MATRKTRQQPREYVTFEQDGKRVVRCDGEYRAEYCGALVGWFKTAFEAEQAVNAYVYQQLTRKAA